MAHVIAQLGHTFVETRSDEALFQKIELKPLKNGNWRVEDSRGVYSQKTTEILLGDGMCDTQVNGTFGNNRHVLLSNSPTAKTVIAMAHHTRATGTTGFCPTMITGSFAQFIEGLEAVKSIPVEERKRLGILGVHLEGRWIDEEKKGIHNPRYMPGVMTKRECDTLCKYGREGILKMLTISPTKVALSQIRQLTAAGILISIGHSTASSSEVAAAIHAGAKCVTHLGDAMKGDFKTRGAYSGVVNSAMLGDGSIDKYPHVYSSLIGDNGVHIEDPFFLLALKNHGAFGHNPEKIRINMTTDAATYPASRSFQFPFGKNGRQVQYDHTRNKCIETTTGTLGGASTTMQDCLDRLLESGVPKRNALHMTGTVARRLLKEPTNTHGGRPNLDGMTLYDEKTLRVIGYFSGGILKILKGQSIENVIV